MSKFADFLSTLRAEDTPPPAPPAPDPQTELVVDKKTGTIRQAGADTQGAWVADFRRNAERSLYTFMTGVLGRKDLTRTLHKPLCDGLQTVPPRRKLRLYPRHHRKTSIISHGLPIHMTIQPADGNVYFGGMPGVDTRILLSTETETLGKGAVRVIQTIYETNRILRALWPHVIWDNPRAEAKKWSELELSLRQTTPYPEATITVRGVGGAITGMHPNVLVKDDLISNEARNSPAVMQSAIDWHVASRGLIEGNDDALEFIIGTRWAKWDLYSYIMENDTLIDSETRSMIEDGAFIFPEKFNDVIAERLRKEMGNELYALLYMNTATGVGLTDFDMAEVRTYTIDNGRFIFAEDERDLVLAEKAKGQAAVEEARERDWRPVGLYGGDRAHRLRLG